MFSTSVHLAIAIQLLAFAAIAQGQDSASSTQTIRVGVANVLNQTTRSVNTVFYRSQLVRSLNDLGSDSHNAVTIEAVPLEATSRKSANSEAGSKGCQYVLLTTLRDFSKLGSVRVGSGGVSTVPDMNVGAPISGDRAVVIEFEATRVGRPRAVAEGTLQPTNSPRADEQLTELVQMEALRVASDLRSDKLEQPD